MELNSHPVFIGAQIDLSLSDCKKVSSGNYKVELDTASYERVEKSFEFLKKKTDQRLPVYGINTQFGDQVSLFDPHLEGDESDYRKSVSNRQENLVRSHTCGLGDAAPLEVVRVAMMLRAHCLSQGFSGVRSDTLNAILSFLNSGIVPVVPRYGSIGASGDLIPLASIACALIGGETEVFYQGQIQSARHALEKAGLKSFHPEIREGLAMINGTSFMTSIASLAVYDLNRLFKQMLSAIGLSLEAFQIIQSAYHPLVHQLKGQEGEIQVNEFLLDFWSGSQLLTDLDHLRSHATSQGKAVQDYYSIRSVAQGFGPFFENLERCSQWVVREMNSVNDNPIIDTDESKIYHGANFMGYYISDTSDILKMNIAQASTWMHALLANLVHPRKSKGLPANLVRDPSQQNGFRPLQLLAAALAVQNRKLGQSHASYMLPTEGDNQDVNSLGTHAAYDLRDSVQNLERLTAILFLAGAQAMEFRGIQNAGKKAQEIYSKIRAVSPVIDDCRPTTQDLEKVIQLLKAEEI